MEMRMLRSLAGAAAMLLTDRPSLGDVEIIPAPRTPDRIGRLLAKAEMQRVYRADWPLPGHGKREVARRLRQMAKATA